jgi:hypothetical protein
MSTHLMNVNTMPGHRNTTLATARGLRRYTRGLFLPNSLTSCPAVASSIPVAYARFVATMYVYGSAQASVSTHAKTEQMRQASLTPRDSKRSGQNRSKKKAAPKMVATKTPTKMLKEPMPT